MNFAQILAFAEAIIVFLLCCTLPFSCTNPPNQESASAESYEFEDIRWGLLDKQGKVTLLESEITPKGPMSYGVVVCSSKKHANQLYLTDKSGKTKTLLSWELTPETQFVEGIAPVKEPGSKYCRFINLNGKPSIDKRYLAASSFSEGLSAVIDESQDSPSPKKYKYIDKKGKTVLAAQYYKAGPFRCGRAIVEMNKLTPEQYVIDRKGKIIYRSHKSQRLSPFSNDGFSVITSIGQAPYPGGLIDINGNDFAYPKRYICFSNGIGLLKNVDSMDPKLSIFADKDGKTVLTRPCALPERVKTQPVLTEGLMPVPEKAVRFVKYHYRGFPVFEERAFYTFVDGKGNPLKITLPANRKIISAFPFQEGLALIETAVPKPTH